MFALLTRYILTLYSTVTHVQCWPVFQKKFPVFIIDPFKPVDATSG